MVESYESHECALRADCSVVNVEYISHISAMRSLVFGGTPCISDRPLRECKDPYLRTSVVRHIYVVNNLFASK
jgi:hypothetical protein